MKFYVGSSMKNCELVTYYTKKLEASGWVNTYNWVKNVNDDIFLEEIIEYAKLERQGISDADVVIIILPGGRGAHIELGMALALGKKIFLCSFNRDEFSIQNTVAFYELPEIVKLVGKDDENIEQIKLYKKF